jgi:hypothetical protein
MQSLEEKQAAICAREGVARATPSPFLKVGIALSTLGQQPLHGLRNRPQSGMSGWFTWAGEQLSDERDFFEPLQHPSSRAAVSRGPAVLGTSSRLAFPTCAGARRRMVR